MSTCRSRGQGDRVAAHFERAQQAADAEQDAAFVVAGDLDARRAGVVERSQLIAFRFAGCRADARRPRAHREAVRPTATGQRSRERSWTASTSRATAFCSGSGEVGGDGDGGAAEVRGH